MNSDNQTNGITLDDLAGMVARGFEDVQGQISELKGEVAEIRNVMATKDDLAELKAELKQEIEGLRNSVNNYLKLSDERYLELKHRQDVIVKWVAKIAEQNKVSIDLSELDWKP